jgi:predicted ATPase/class 3 adenylate cyclase
VTFLFSDVEGSTRLWEAHGQEMRSALAVHDGIVRGEIEGHGGYVFATGGDGFGAAFARAGDAVVAALAAQRGMAEQDWPDDVPLRVRMGLHTGEAEERDGDYFGPEVNRAARLMAVAHGGQIVCSQATAEMARSGLPPGVSLADLGAHRLRDLSEPLRVFQVVGDGLPSRFPPLLSMDAFPGNLPLQVSSFIGRDMELVRVAKALGEARVVTLTGVGGVGKTRLALRAAAEALPRFREGAWLVELQGVRDPEAVAGAVAAVFSLTDRAGMNTTETLIEFLRSKQLLLVLDNCEHLLDPTAELVEALERACPGVVVLATSREGLAIEGERVITVPALSAPAADADLPTVNESEAVRLFVERAGWVDPDFELTDTNAPTVAQLCRRLDGLPLAIELAAARIGAMTPAELARRLDRRFDTLAGGRRRAVQRHQTLRAAIDWSYQLCSEAERRLLARLSVFAGGSTEEAAEAVCSDDPLSPDGVFQLLAGLVAKSLVVAQRDGPATRYRLLETIREYGEDRLADYGETDQLRYRHAEYYCQLAAGLGDGLERREQLDAAGRMRAELDNLLAAVNHAVDTADADLGLRILRHIPIPAYQLGFAVYLPVQAVIGLPGATSHDLYPGVLAVSAALAANRGELERVEEACQEALHAAARLGSERERRWVEQRVTATRTVRAFALGRWRESARYSEQSARLALQVGQDALAARALAAGAMSYIFAGDPDAGVGLADEGLQLARSAAVPIMVAFCLVASAGTLAGRAPRQARDLLEEGLALRESLDFEVSPNELAQATFIAARLVDRPLTLQLAERSIRHLQWSGQRFWLAGILNVVAGALADIDMQAAARLQGAARHLTVQVAAARLMTAADAGPVLPRKQSAGFSMIGDLQRQTSQLLHEALDEERLRQLRIEGEAMDSDQAATYALEAIRRARQSQHTDGK